MDEYLIEYKPSVRVGRVLKRLVETGLYGSTSAEALDRIVCAYIEQEARREDSNTYPGIYS